MKRSKTKPAKPEIKLETLRPLPVRITQRQYLRLVAHREIDQLAIQEHVRRALDLYLDDLDWRRTIQLGGNPGNPPSAMSRPRQEPPSDAKNGEEPSPNAEKPAKDRPKLVYR